MKLVAYISIRGLFPVLMGLATSLKTCGGRPTAPPPRPKTQLKALAPLPKHIDSQFTSFGRPDDPATLTGGFILNVPSTLEPGELPGLLLSFHGDGRAKKGWNEPRAMDRLARTGERFKLITVAMQEPHRFNWWEGKVKENVRYVDDFIQNYVLPRVRIDQRHIFFTGVSGGADFAGCIFPPQTRYKYHGAALVTCGGDLPTRMLAPPPTVVTDAMRAGFRFYFADVEDDPDFPPALVSQTVDYFSDLGFEVDRVTAGHHSLTGTRDFGSGHCSFDTPGWRDEFLQRYYDEDESDEGGD